VSTTSNGSLFHFENKVQKVAPHILSMHISPCPTNARPFPFSLNYTLKKKKTRLILRHAHMLFSEGIWASCKFPSRPPKGFAIVFFAGDSQKNILDLQDALPM